MAKTTPDRQLHIDALKAVASQLIVLHHLAFYGPMSDHADALAPALFAWLGDNARMAVQVFLVLSGYLCVQRLAPQGHWRAGLSLPGQVGQRYLRLVLPYAVMLGLTIAASALARRWMAHESVSDPATAGQVLAHLLLLHDVLDIEALSAGVWYVAIDLQLFALLALLLAGSAVLERRLALGWPLAPWLVLAGVAVSLLGFNLEPAWDEAAPYFFGAYGLGVLAAWWRGGTLRPAAFWSVGLMLLVALALLIEWRARIALAGATALVLAGWRWPLRRIGATKGAALMARAGQISYAIFLVHFPVCLLVNALFTHFLPLDAGVQLVGVLTAWLGSIAAGAAFHHLVEQPAMRWVSSLRWLGVTRAAS